MTTPTSLTNTIASFPDYFSSAEECKKKIKQNTNPKYRTFKQTHKTAGDVKQFYEMAKLRFPLEISEGNRFRSVESENNLVHEANIVPQGLEPLQIPFFSKFKITPVSVKNTFNYIFFKFKKAIYVRIVDNKLEAFIPFSNAHFVNEWYPYLRDPNPVERVKQLDLINTNVNRNVKNWYANNCLIRYEFPQKEEDTNVANYRDLLITLCNTRKLPNVEFFINRRDFPIMTRDGTEAYTALFGHSKKLVSHNYNYYSPILSPTSTSDNADILIPTGEDWARVGMLKGKYFHRFCDKNYTETFDDISWETKKNVAVFRGASTGSGTTIEDNNRLRLAWLSTKHPDVLDAGITKWNQRPRIVNQELKDIDVSEMKELGVELVSELTSRQQAGYKYIVNVDGHVSAFRLSFELSMGCCILLVESKYKLWFSDSLIPYVHFVPVKSDLSNLIEQIEWCKLNDSKCKKIADNALEFYKNNLQEEHILDYFQKLLINLSKLVKEPIVREPIEKKCSMKEQNELKDIENDAEFIEMFTKCVKIKNT